jgi:superfamily II DNA helicase RecQ
MDKTGRKRVASDKGNSILLDSKLADKKRKVMNASISLMGKETQYSMKHTIAPAPVNKVITSSPVKEKSKSAISNILHKKPGGIVSIKLGKNVMQKKSVENKSDAMSMLQKKISDDVKFIQGASQILESEKSKSKTKTKSDIVSRDTKPSLFAVNVNARMRPAPAALAPTSASATESNSKVSNVFFSPPSSPVSSSSSFSVTANVNSKKLSTSISEHSTNSSSSSGLGIFAAPEASKTASNSNFNFSRPSNDFNTGKDKVKSKGIDEDEPYENFVKKNLKKSGTTYKKMQKDPRFNKKVYDKDFRKDKSGNDNERNYSNSSGNSNTSSSSIKPKESKVGYGGTGLDILHMTLYSSDVDKKDNDKVTKQSLSEISRRGKKSKQNPYGLTDDFFEKHAPKCSGHEMCAKMLTVKKDGPNKGKKFYGCCFNADQRCKFFMWVDENPDILPILLALGEEKESRESRVFSSTIDREHGTEHVETWKQFAIKQYLQRLEDMNVSELRDEAHMCKNRRILTLNKTQKQIDADTSLVKLSTTGKKDDVIARLGKEALRVLDIHMKMKEEGQGREQKRDNLMMTSAPELQSNIDANADVQFGDSSDEDIMLESDSDDSLCIDSSFTAKKVVVEDEDEDEDENADEDEDLPDMVVDANANTMAENPLGRALIECFGFMKFRAGQEWAAQRALDGLNSLLVMPTGAGKSLCYMLPATLLPGLTLVVSPLISLMQDQLRKLPVQLPGACFGSGMSVQEVAYTSAMVLKGHIKVLYVSPEKLCTSSFRKLMRDLKGNNYHNVQRKNSSDISNPLSLMCVDEAHCLSQWSYNFRPAFLRIQREIAHLRPRAIIALTATAPPHIQNDIMGHLQVPIPDGLCSLSAKRKNLYNYSRKVLSDNRLDVIMKIIKDSVDVDMQSYEDEDEDEDRDKNSHSESMNKGGGNERAKNMSKRKFARSIQDIDKIRSSSKSSWNGDVMNSQSSNGKVNIKDIPNTIVYMWRRDQAQSCCEFLQSHGLPAVAYHAGMDVEQRQKSQSMFDRGTARIVVATTAFGMGVDKSDVRQVIHGTLPKSVESYLQETGRAGRDGKPAMCHMLLCEEDIISQHSLSHTNLLAEMQVATLLTKTFVAFDTNFMNNHILRNRVSISLQKIAEQCDIGDAPVETILSILEMKPFELLQVDGIHLDIIQGSFRLPSLKVDEFSETDILVKALLQLNETPPTAMKNSIKSWGINLASQRYTNNSGSMYQQKQQQQRAGASSDLVGHPNEYDKVSFRLSLLRLAEHCSLSRDETSYGLYSLQKRGILEYSLSDPALYITLKPRGHAMEGYHKFFTTGAGAQGKVDLTELQAHQMNFCYWIWKLALRVTQSINDNEGVASQRNIDIWQAGHVMKESPANVENPDSLQNNISDFLCYYLDCVSGSSVTSRYTLGSNDSLSDSEQVVQQLYAQFLDVKSPLMSCQYPEKVNTDTHEDVESIEDANIHNSSVIKSIIDDANNALCDPNVKEILDNVSNGWKSFLHKLPLLKSNDNDDNNNNDKETDKEMEVVNCILASQAKLQALYACKILHGLSTPLLNQGARNNSVYWAKYKDTHFGSMFTLLNETFTSQQHENEKQQQDENENAKNN